MTAARGPGKPRALTPEREAMVAALRREGFGVAAIAAVFGVAPRTAHAIAKREGIETTRGRRVLTVAQEHELVELWRDGWTHQQLAEHYGVARETVALAIQGAIRR